MTVICRGESPPSWRCVAQSVDDYRLEAGTLHVERRQIIHVVAEFVEQTVTGKM